MAEGSPIQVARAVRAAALAADGVYDLGKGRFVEAATYEAGDKVSGVVVDDDSVEVHVVLDYPLARPIPELGQELKRNLDPESGGRAVSLVFEDVVDEAEKVEKALRAAEEARATETGSQ